MTTIPDVGDYVTFLNANGYPTEREEAARVLDVNRTYVVRKCRIGTWISHLSFDETGDRMFNSVMFRRVDAAGNPITDGAPFDPTKGLAAQRG